MDIKYFMVIGICLLLIVGIYYVLRKRHQRETEGLLEELTLFKKEKEYVSEAMMVFSENYDIVFANPSAKALFSLDEHNNFLPHATQMQLKSDTAEVRNFFEVIETELDKRENSFHLQNVLLIGMGKTRQVNVYVDRSGWNLNKTISCVIEMQSVSSVESVTIQKENGGKDFFTGFSSQFKALTEINTFVIEMQKKSESFTLFLLGIDHFNDLQTTLGLNFSNKIIKKIAEYLKQYEENLHIYKMDCDKFLLVSETIKSEEEMYNLAQKIISDMKRNTEKNVHLTTSIGIATYPTHGENAVKLINHVYIALEQAQKEKEGNIKFFTTEIQVVHKDELKMNEEIQTGLENHEFFLYYQPIFNLKSEEMIGVEALIRWKHPVLGLITADKFIDVAKKTGLIVDIGEYAFKEAIKQRKIWNESGLKNFKITLNLSLKEMQVDKLIQKLQILFEDSSIDPKNFNLDITESSAMANIEKTVLDFKLFKDLGLSISLDHFGAGASSLKHLQMLPLSMIKIDRSLISNLDTNLNHQIIVKAMISLIHSLGFKVVAEGLETSKESGLLYTFGCDYAQGYLYAKPLPAHELEDLLR